MCELNHSRHHGNQGILDEASHSLLENEFGTHKVEECIQQILEKGEVKEQKGREREGTTVCCPIQSNL